MKLGMNMLLWSPDVAGEEFDSVFALLRDAGYAGIEVGVFDADTAKYERLGVRLRALGVEPLAITARFADESPISADPGVRARALAAMKAGIESCAALGSSVLCGPMHCGLGAFSGAPPTADERAWAVEYLRAAAEHAAPYAITLAIEFLSRFEMYLTTSAAETAALVREVDHPSCRMMYDTFQALIEETDPREALRACADVLVHVHLAESGRAAPGAGQVDWHATFATLEEIGYDGWLVVESFGRANPDFAAATKTWRESFESEEQLARDAAAFVRGRVAV